MQKRTAHHLWSLLNMDASAFLLATLIRRQGEEGWEEDLETELVDGCGLEEEVATQAFHLLTQEMVLLPEEDLPYAQGESTPLAVAGVFPDGSVLFAVPDPTDWNHMALKGGHLSSLTEFRRMAVNMLARRPGR